MSDTERQEALDWWTKHAPALNDRLTDLLHMTYMWRAQSKGRIFYQATQTEYEGKTLRIYAVLGPTQEKPK